MAENTKTYTTIIDVDTKDAAKNIDLLNKTVSTSLGDFDNLNEAISKTQDTLGKLDPKSDEFKELSKELQGLKDNLRDTEIQSLRFTEALAAQPGVVGLVGQSLEGLRNTFRIFMANPIIAVLAGITGGLLALRESLTRTEEGQEKLNKITDGFTKILNGLFAIIEPIANAVADFTIAVLENDKVLNVLTKTVGVLSGVFTGILGALKEVGEFVGETLVTNFRTLIGVAKGAGEVLEGVFTFDWDKIKSGANAAFEAVSEGVTQTVENVKDLGEGVAQSAVAGFEGAREGFEKGFTRLTEREKELEAEREEERLKREEERLAKVEEAEKILTEARLSQMENRDRELLLAEEEFIQKRKTLEEAGYTDFTLLEEEYNQKVLEINKNFDDELQREREERLNQRRELFQQNLEAQQAQLELGFQVSESEFNRRLALVNEKESLLLSVEELTEEQRTQIQEDAANERLSIQEERFDKRLEFIDNQESLLLQKINETETLLLENENLTEEERLRIREEAAQQRLQLEITTSQQRGEIRQAEIEDELANIESELAVEDERYQRKIELVNQQEALLLQQEGLTQAQRTAIQRDAAEQRKQIELDEFQARKEIQGASLDLLGEFGSFLSTIAGENKKLQIAAVVAEQAAAIGRIVVNTAVANAKAVAASPLTLGQPWVGLNTVSAGIGIATSIASAVKAIRDINSADGETGTASTDAGGARNLPQPTPPSIRETSIPEIVGGEAESQRDTQIAETIGRSQQKFIPQITGGELEPQRDTKIAETIGSSQQTIERNGEPVRAYVVSEDITSNIALNRRINNSASF